jgi:hypothetical protein
VEGGEDRVGQVPPCAAKLSWECAFVVMRSEVDRGCTSWDSDAWELRYRRGPR